MLWATMFISFILIVLLVLVSWYAVQMTKRMLFVSENLDWLIAVVEEYRVHLETVYNMETYHGEPIVQNLIAHTKDVEKQIKNFEQTYSLEEGQDGPEEREFAEEKEE